jgi:hypothetical protein
MTETHEYLVPDYYSNFTCKMGACRTACCEGWPISLTMQDYFKLLGVDCSPELRAKLDCAMHLTSHPTQEAYAQITPRFDGNCPLRMDDGRCAVHNELGDGALSYICRLYPRGPRTEGDYECSCSNSCEAVLELMFSRDAPISFETRRLTFDLPKPTGRTVFFETVGRGQEIRLYFISKIQDRSLPLPLRIMSLGQCLMAMETALAAKDAREVDLLLNGKSVPNSFAETAISQSELNLGLNVASGMLKILDEHSRSIRSYGEASLAYFGNDGQNLARYERAKAHFETVLPKWDIWFEHMLVNHMFFERFPFQNRPESMSDEFIAICAVYAVLRFLGIGWMADKNDGSAFVDVAAAAFRLIDHTQFDRSASYILKKLDCSSHDRLFDLIRL